MCADFTYVCRFCISLGIWVSVCSLQNLALNHIEQTNPLHWRFIQFSCNQLWSACDDVTGDSSFPHTILLYSSKKACKGRTFYSWLKVIVLLVQMFMTYPNVWTQFNKTLWRTTPTIRLTWRAIVSCVACHLELLCVLQTNMTKWISLELQLVNME